MGGEGAGGFGGNGGKEGGGSEFDPGCMVTQCVEVAREKVIFLTFSSAVGRRGTYGRWKQLRGGAWEMREDAARRVGRRVESRPRGNVKLAQLGVLVRSILLEIFDKRVKFRVTYYVGVVLRIFCDTTTDAGLFEF